MILYSFMFDFPINFSTVRIHLTVDDCSTLALNAAALNALIRFDDSGV